MCEKIKNLYSNDENKSEYNLKSENIDNIMEENNKNLQNQFENQTEKFEKLDNYIEKSMKISSEIKIFPMIFLGILIGIILKLFVLDILQISGTSMKPTFDDGNVIFVNRLYYGFSLPFGDELLLQWKKPKKNDIVIYLHDNKIVIKRVVALAGETLEYSEDLGYNLILTETSSKTRIPLTAEQFQLMKDSKFVPEGTVLAVGDNYSDSIDSRNYGFVPVKNILGKVFNGN